MRTCVRPLAATRLLKWPLLALLLVPTSVLSQDEPVDPEEVLEEMHDLQRDFERFRESRTPVEVQRANGVCDERIGRICIWFGGEGEETFPAELREVRQARNSVG